MYFVPHHLPATELTVQSAGTVAGTVAGKTLLLPVGPPGFTCAHLQDWLTEKRKTRAAVNDIGQQVLVKGIKHWAVFEEQRAGATVRTVFKIT